MLPDRFAATAAALALGLCAIGAAQTASAPLDLGHPAIAYGLRPSTDPVARLSARLQRGEVSLRFDDRTGLLRSLLDHLDIPVESQLAVFSKTSLQSARITPSNPRAIYFNDAVAVAWMRGGFIELAAHDAQQGTAFYLLPQAPGAQIFPDARCLGCHYSAVSGGVPGFLVRSIPTARDGQTLPWLGNATPDHRTPLEERWGGWFVTGTVRTRHLGNLQLADRRVQELPAHETRSLNTLADQFDTSGYLSPHSDAVALLVFDHQATMTNLLTRTGWQARIAAHDGSAAASAALRDTVNELVDYMLFVDEAKVDGVSGTSGYAERFSARGPRDSRGRSLRDLDLRTRLLRYPCSYMIYSPAFDGLPADVRASVYGRLKDVLTGTARDPKYARLAAADRQAILEILRETKTDLPAGF